MAGSKDIVLSGVVVAQEILSALQLPGASLTQKAVEAALSRRAKAGREILFETIRQEGLDFSKPKEEVDDFIQMMMRFSKSVNEGTARQNLKLLAQVMVGLKKNRTMDFDKFQSCANVIETLTRDEILFIGKLKVYSDSSDDFQFGRFKIQVEKEIPGLDAEICAASLVRTGMVLPISTIKGIFYRPTQRLHDICNLSQVSKSTS